MKHTTTSAIGADMVQEVNIITPARSYHNSTQRLNCNKSHKAIVLEAQQREVNRVSDNIDFRNLRKSGALRR